MDKSKKKKLAEWLANSCPHLNKFNDDESKYYCTIKYNNRCRNMDFFVDYPDCPETCPHHPKAVTIKCDGEKCKRIKILLQELLDIIDNE